MDESEAFYVEKIEEFKKTSDSLYTILKNEENVEKRLKLQELI